jgi:hypothetical protein
MIVLKDDLNQSDMCNPSQKVMDLHSHIDEINDLDNRGERICRPLFSHSSFSYALNLDKEVWLKDWDGKEEFFYCAFTHHNQKLWPNHINLISDKVLDGVKDEKGYLLFDNTLEGNRVDGEWFIEPFYKSMKELELPYDRVIFITNNYIAEKTHDEWFENQNLYKEKMKLIAFMWDVYHVRNIIRDGHLPSKVDIEEEIKYKKINVEYIKYFMKVNRTNRPERNIFMLFMNYHKLFDKSLISFPTLPDEWYPNGFEKYLTDDNVNNLRLKVPFDIDKTDETNHGDAGSGEGFFNADLPFQPVHYKNSFISIIFCAFPFEKNACHLHTSTINPIYCGHPFVQFGPYKALEVMKERGFKTFNKWWDESYDDEPDGWKRFQKVMDVTLELSKLSQKELLEIYIDMKEVLQHNVDLITNFDVKSELYDRIFDE